ncbi:DegT/DnrJ/EryC1/StrS family aminotransferase [Kitasatospora sp. MAP5-34]|uniref:DegT/DnrJ/EryC1/StrS family aminotransferase n=1 Tax=Kitasatospora sp. MAP5-34 TaxID=3035102 RepID=UPI002476D785|nr:DegT/DnrJ/EryC1/StrS family aminotransferase [Kitasatospora sp. MAP5-34]MDH6579301.1 perosamine synthetase [Kitasatospora sp. MAP5-34]
MDVPAARVVYPEDDRSAVADAVKEILATGALTLGPRTERFETAFAAVHEVPHAVAVNTGTAALEIVLRIAEVAGRDVVVPANTFYASAAAVLHAGGRPVFADVSAETFALSVATVEAALTPATAAVLLVHVGGLITPEVDAIRRLCDARGIPLIEDAAHAHGCSYDGRFAGSFGLAGAFSFYATKVTTSGEGGMLVTASDELRDEARIYRDQGKGSFGANHHVRDGYSWRLSEVNAAIGEIHLRRLKEFIETRREVADRYTAALAGLPGLQPLVEPPKCRSNYYKYMVLLPTGVDRAHFKREVSERFGVRLPGEVYDLPLHHQPVLAPYADGPLPVAEDVCARHICLPVHSDMRDDEVDQVLTAISAVHADLIG